MADSNSPIRFTQTANEIFDGILDDKNIRILVKVLVEVLWFFVLIQVYLRPFIEGVR